MKSFEIIAPYFAWVNKENFPYVAQVYGQLDIPFWDDYSEAFHQSSADLIQACQSSFKFLDLTLRPFLQLLFIILSGLFELLLKKGLISLQKGSEQAKAGIIWFYKFQRSLTKEQVLGEIGIVGCLFAIYFLRKWLKRQTYWTRGMKWVSNQKRKVKKSYTNAVKHLSEVSLVLAMTVPHLFFLGIVVASKILLPRRILEWVVHETYMTTAMCLWYPFVSTLVLIHSRRQEGKSPDENQTLVAKAGEKSAGKATKNKTSAELKISTSNKSRLEKKTSKGSSRQSDTSASFWLQYWITYSIIQAFGQVCHMVPVFGRFVAKHPFFQSLSAEFNLFFFVWVFTMEALMGGNTEDAFLAQASPLKLTTRYLNPVILDLDTVVSQAISAEKWKKLVFSKAQRILDVFVMVRFLSEERKDWLLHILEESRVLLIPSITLMMPSFATQFGVAYVQYIVPSAKSARARGANSQFLFLQYWVLHCMFFGLLTWLAPVLWWIPFSTHVMFIAWCNLSFPKTIDKYYAVLEMELVTFGVLSGTSGIAVNDTRTAQLLNAISKRLPSSQDGDSVKSAKTDGNASSTASVPDLSSEKSTTSLSSAREKDANTTSPGAGDASIASSPLP
eukprot:CAMPEP_0113609830 /NCGR_PEP_ID=MMETSP0017_2-20120614/4701_1 /TAXON_ID=2856 /ORGANISM="Cylindrotheca closterium" /LENGTH=615 /DNA_ID=CAMNT_0000518675 /DNA_START=111 /DNA_END=1958 /DNA_ORIENTATION=- /assembly_acc=CAM_ASM_000147